MTEKNKISFNLWTEPWITLEKRNGGVETLSIQQTLIHAQEYRAIFDPSPLVVTGTHRLLTAIVQFTINPQENEDLRQLWGKEQFSPEVIDAFGMKYADRFDLFSDRPFMQSADLPKESCGNKDVSAVSRLTYDIPSGTYVSHYRHGEESTAIFCPVCVAKYLTAIPAFATSGGPGIKPSINGVPPIYIIPGGENLYQSLVASLVTPLFQPEIRSRENDLAWWQHSPIVENKGEITEIGYCHSLTFPARRIRVYPIVQSAICTRCGSQAELVVRKIVFEMGEMRPEISETWFDPFVSYKLPSGKQASAKPIRPDHRKRGWAIWREFAGLFLVDKKRTGKKADTTLRPKVIDQLNGLDLKDHNILSFRCVTLVTDNKAKFFQWMDAGFEVPLTVLRDENAGYEIRRAVGFAAVCNEDADKIFNKYFRRPKSQQYEIIKQRREDTYWEHLADPFRLYVLEMGSKDFDFCNQHWCSVVVKHIRDSFNEAAQYIGDDGEQLGRQAMAEKALNRKLEIRRKEFLNE